MQPDNINLSFFILKIIWSDRIHSLKYQRSTTLGCIDKEIRKSEFVARTQFLCPYLLMKRNYPPVLTSWIRKTTFRLKLCFQNFANFGICVLYILFFWLIFEKKLAFFKFHIFSRNFLETGWSEISWKWRKFSPFSRANEIQKIQKFSENAKFQRNDFLFSLETLIVTHSPY